MLERHANRPKIQNAFNSKITKNPKICQILKITSRKWYIFSKFNNWIEKLRSIYALTFLFGSSLTLKIRLLDNSI